MADPGGVDIATLGLRVDGRQFKADGDAASQTLEKMAVSGEKAEKSIRSVGETYKGQGAIMAAAAARIEREQKRHMATVEQVSREQGRAQAQAVVEGLEREFQLSMAVIKEQQARGFLTPAEARTAGKETGLAFNAGLIRELDRRQIGAGRDPVAFTKLAGSLKNVNEVSRTAGVGIGRLGESMVSLTRQVTGVNPVVAQLSYVIGGMGIGTTMMIGVLGGMAALALAFKALAREAIDARRELNKQLDVLRQIAEERRIEAQGGTTAIAVSAGQAEARRLRALLQTAIELDNKALVESYGLALAEQNRLVREGLAELEEEEAESNRRRIAEEDRARKERIDALRKEHREVTQILSQANDRLVNRLAATTERRLAVITAAQKSEARKFEEMANSLERFTAFAQGNRSGGEALSVAEVLGGRDIERVNRDVEKLIDLWASMPNSVETSLNAMEQINARLRESGHEYEDLIGSLQQYIEMIEKAAQLEEKRAQIATVSGIVRGATSLTGGAPIASIGMSALTGGVAGATAAGLTALGSWVKGMEDAAERIWQAQQRFSSTMDDLLASFAIDTDFEHDMENQRRQLNTLLSDFSQAYGLDASAVRIQPFASPEEIVRFMDSFTSAAGEGSAAIDEWRRITEWYTRAVDQAREADQKRVDDTVRDLLAREAELGGNTVEATRIRRQAAANEEIAALQELADAGSITAEQMSRFARVIDDELAAAIEEAARAAAEATRALRDDFTARAMDLFAPPGMAARFRLDARHRQERIDAEGQSPDTLLLIDLVQQGERAQLAFDTRAQAIRDAASEQIAAIERQTDIAREQLFKAEEQLRAQERATEATRRVVESLDAFSGSLILGPLSPLSHASRLKEARSQFGGLSELALGGDVSSAESLPGASRALLEASRAFNASGPAYVADFERVRAIVDEVQDRFADQLTIEERILAELELQTASARDQIVELERQRDAILAAADIQIAAVRQAHEAEMTILRQQLKVFMGVGDKLTDVEVVTDPVILNSMTEGNRLVADSLAALQAGFEDMRTGFDAVVGRVARMEATLEAAQDRTTSQVRRSASDLESDVAVR